jgi:hypothetical protein
MPSADWSNVDAATPVRSASKPRDTALFVTPGALAVLPLLPLEEPPFADAAVVGDDEDFEEPHADMTRTAITGITARRKIFRFFMYPL